jgi:hypothetical protein
MTVMTGDQERVKVATISFKYVYASMHGDIVSIFSPKYDRVVHTYRERNEKFVNS